MDIVLLFAFICISVVVSVLVITNLDIFSKSNNYQKSNIYIDDYPIFDYSYSKSIEPQFTSNTKKYFGPNTKCFSCERQMLNNKEYSSRPTKCFSCEMQSGSFGNPTKCFSCGK